MPNNFVPLQTDIPQVDIQVGDVSGLDNISPIFDAAEAEEGVWSDYYVMNHYEADGQIYMMPVTSSDGLDGDSVAFVKLAGGTLLWIVDWTAERAGTKPTIPNPILEDANLVLLDKHFMPDQLLKYSDGTISYRISGRYVYGFKNPESSTLYYGRAPWMSKEVDCAVEESQFKDGIITCNTSQQSTGSENSPSNPDQVGSF